VRLCQCIPLYIGQLDDESIRLYMAVFIKGFPEV